MTKAWILAVAASAVLLIGAVTVALVSGSGGNGGTRHATPVPVSTPSPAAPAQAAPLSADPATAATAIQVQEVLAGIITRLQTPGPDGQVKAVTPAEINAQVQTELAKIGVHR